MPRREDLARHMLALAKDGYPENERARNALSVLTYADREAANEFVQPIKFARQFPVEYRAMVAQQLASINTDASMRKLDELLAGQGDPKLGLFISRSTRRYIPVEDLGRLWQERQDTATLNLLTSEWIRQIYEGYPLDAVIAVMGPPQDSDPHYVHYVSKEGHMLYLEINKARQIGGWDGPR